MNVEFVARSRGTGERRRHGADAKASLEQLDARYDDLLAALAWFIDAGRTDEALRLANALYRFWITKQRFAEGAVWFDRVLALPGGDALLRCRATLNAGFMPFWMGDDERAAELFGQALEMGRSLGDAPLTSQALGGLARVALRTDVAEGRRLAGEALAVSDAADDEAGSLQRAPSARGRRPDRRRSARGPRMDDPATGARPGDRQRVPDRVRGLQPQHGRAPARRTSTPPRPSPARRWRSNGGRAPSSRPRSPSAAWHPSPRNAASSTAPRHWSVPPRRSWRPRGWPGRQTNDPTTNACWRPCPRRWARPPSRKPAPEGGRCLPARLSI